MGKKRKIVGYIILTLLVIVILALGVFEFVINGPVRSSGDPLPSYYSKTKQ